MDFWHFMILGEKQNSPLLLCLPIEPSSPGTAVKAIKEQTVQILRCALTRQAQCSPSFILLESHLGWEGQVMGTRENSDW